MALFGYPQAQENDAERAVRAARAIQRALTELNRKNEGAGKPALAARIAIDTGPAVLDASGEVFGDVANVAARAQALADSLNHDREKRLALERSLKEASVDDPVDAAAPIRMRALSAATKPTAKVT